MNQTCKVCGEPAAGFHFGAFTCEGCKSFFGRSYNNLSSISECKNNGECVINKKNRTACKACRLRKCLMVGMSKSGSRYGRRSNWFKIHCLLQEQQAAAAAAAASGNHKTPPPQGLSMLCNTTYPPGMYTRPPCTKEELMLLGLEDYHKRPSASPSVSSPDSHNSDSSVEVGDKRNSILRKMSEHNQPLNKELFLPLPFPGMVMPPPGFLPPSHLLFSGYHHALYPHHQGLLKPSNDSALVSSAAMHANNNSKFMPNNNHSKSAEELSKRFFLDAVLKSQRSPSNGTAKSEEEEIDTEDVVALTPPRSPVPPQDNPIDLSMKSESSISNENRPQSEPRSCGSEYDHDRQCGNGGCISDLDDDHEYEREVKRKKIQGPTPLDLTTKA